MSENKNHSAQRMNIEAVKRIVTTVRTTLGPMGMDKMMVDGGGNVIVTNDGATILRELDSAHPAAKMIVEISKMQEANCYDGTTSSVVLAGQLLTNAETLFDRGLHPNVINKGYMRAMEMVRELLPSMAVEAEDIDISSVASTAITGKSLESSQEQVAQLCVDTIDAVGDVRDVRVLAVPGGALSESFLYEGVVVNKDFVTTDGTWNGKDIMPVLLINSGLERQKQNDNVQVQVDADSYSKVKNAGRETLLTAAKQIVSSDAKVVFVRDGVDDTVVQYLRKQDVYVCRRVPESTMKRLSNELGFPVYQAPEDDMGPIGGLIERRNYNDVDYLFVSSNLASSEATLVLSGATQSTLDEVQRGFDDALGVVSLVRNGDTVCFGGGATYVELASHLRTRANEVGGRAQMAIEAFADALESIPMTIAENAGHDALDTVLSMRHEGLPFGPDVENGGVTSMQEAGVWEPTSLIRSAISSATEVASAILRIDDIIGRRGE
jgi:chaperonin GroEL (HSP60 family)|tara:strand:+ start:119 stop:1600 length:1482 start_codon:yes stop_codon:yes gene_type:complete